MLVKRASSTKNHIPLAVNLKTQASARDELDQSQKVKQTHVAQKIAAKNQQTIEHTIQKVSGTARTKGSPTETKVISYAKIQQACKNAASKYKKINLIAGSDKTPPPKKSRNAADAGKTSEKQSDSAQLAQSKSVQNVPSEDLADKPSASFP